MAPNVRTIVKVYHDGFVISVNLFTKFPPVIQLICKRTTVLSVQGLWLCWNVGSPKTLRKAARNSRA